MGGSLVGQICQYFAKTPKRNLKIPSQTTSCVIGDKMRVAERREDDNEDNEGR
jgi:hypothetical protein